MKDKIINFKYENEIQNEGVKYLGEGLSKLTLLSYFYLDLS